MTCIVYTCHDVIPLAPGTEQRGTLNLDDFFQQLRMLKRLGVQFIAMHDLQTWLNGRKKIPKHAAILTFDDAYESIQIHLFPFLKKENIPFTIFVIAGFIGCQSNLYTQAGGHLRRHLGTAALKQLIQSGQVEIGSHGYNHFNLNQITGERLRQEIYASKELLEDLLQIKVPYFAYPYGNSTDSVVEKVKAAGYKLAFTTQKQKLVSADVDLFRLPRVNWGRRSTLLQLYKYYLIPWFRAAG